MRNALLVFAIIVFVLSFVVSLGSQDKDLGWVDGVLKVVQPHSLDPDPRALTIHNINRHLEEAAHLRLQGVPESEIAAVLKRQQAEVGTGSISGDVFWDHEYSISVRAYDEFGNYAGSDYISSHWSYMIEDLRPGKYYVRTNSEYYEDRYFRNTTDWKKARLVKVKSGKETRNIDLTATPYWGKCSITGKVKSQGNNPISDCSIYVYQDEFSLIRAVQPDGNGAYAANNLPGGEYKLRCRYTGSAGYADEWYRDAPNYDTANTVTTAEPNPTTGIEFVLEKAGRIKGKVLDYKGKKPERYRCSVTVYDGDQNYIKSSSLDEKGSFLCDGIRPGAYKLYVDYRGAENCLDGWYKNTDSFNKAKTIQVKPNSTKNVKIKLRKGGAITGKVADYKGEAISEMCRISAYDLQGGWVDESTVGQDGTYVLNGLASGSYKLHADEKEFYLVLGEQPAGEWYSGKSSFLEAQPVQVQVPHTTSNIDFSFEQGGYIRGRITISGVQSSLMTSVDAYDLERRWIKDSIVIANGQYFITGLASGEYRLRASAYVGGKSIVQWYGHANSFETAKGVTVEAPHAVTGIDIDLEPSAYIQGYVLDAKKKRMAEDSTSVQIYAYDASSEKYAGFDTNSFVGGYTIRLLSGRYKIGAVSIHADWMDGGKKSAVGYYRAGTSFYDPKTQAISLASGSTKKLKGLVLKNANGAVSGTVYDARSNQPITDGLIVIWVFDEDGFLVTASVTSEMSGLMTGDYVAPGLRPGTYYLLLWFFRSEGNTSEDIWQWYSGVDVDVPLEFFVPKMDIPSGAYAVVVGNGDTQGIDFHIDRSK